MQTPLPAVLLAPTVLLAEDNPADVLLVREAFLAHDIRVNLRVFTDGAAAIRFIEDSEGDESVPRPVLALLDLNLPKRTGLEILARLRASGTWRAMKVVMISSSRGPQGTGDARFIVGADYFFSKPNDHALFMELGRIAKQLLEAA